MKIWQPGTPVLVPDFLQWHNDAARDESTNRDLRATARLCELLGLCSQSDAQGFLPDFAKAAAQGYDIVINYDFASVSTAALNSLYERLLRKKLGKEGFKVLYVSKDWWTEEILNDRENSTGQVVFGFKQANGNLRLATCFGRSLAFDTTFDASEPNTQLALLNRMQQKIMVAHDGGIVAGALPIRNVLIWALMDLIDDIDRAQDERRVPLSYYYRDMTLGRRGPGGYVGCFGVGGDSALSFDGSDGYGGSDFGFPFGGVLKD
ncbi:hypothetical protein FWF48_03420 [Candidatus Saccharibacteria bacterium]|nr:hypothetical protein [Candidatus Saccharibacteria bacterium]